MAELVPGLPELELPGPHRGLVDRLEEVAAVLGGAVAVESGDVSLTYRDLMASVCRVADELAGLESPGPVGVLAEQGVDSVVAMLGVIAAGRPCVVLDVRQPEARLVQVASRAGLRLVLADDERRDAEVLSGVCPVRPLRPGTSGPARAVRPAVTLDDPATVVFTSGSTGEPKGVVLRHATMLSTALIGRVRFGIGPGDRVSLILPQAFAAGQELVAMALLNGATLCVQDPRSMGRRELVDWLLDSRVTTLHATPSLLRAVVGALGPDEVLPGVRLVTTCGEKVFGSDATAALQHVHGRFVNWLGSSETGMLATYEVLPGQAVPDGPLPAGLPVPTREVAVVGEDGAEVPAGTVGTMVVTSAYLPGGYWQEPAALVDRFTPLPDGRTRYRSGDRAQIDADGTLVLRGRVDDAAKIRGYLVEPADVETALRGLPDVLDVVVRAVPEETGEQRLVAWVVPVPSRRTPSPAALRADTGRSLPDYMVPRDVVLVTELPRNERGKVDVGALPAPPPRPEPTPPGTPTERRLERIWAEVLRLDHVGRDESFTALGGDSLSVEEMLERVDGDLGRRLTTGNLAENPTLQQFAALVDRAAVQGRLPRSSGLVRLRPPGCRAPVFCVAGAGGAAAFFESFAAGLGPDRGVSAIQARGFEERGLPDWTVGQAARRALRIVEQAAPEGPLALVGHSLGGLVALRVAQLLGERGRSVSLLTLLDTFLPPAAKPDDAPRTMGPAGGPVDRGELWGTRLRILGAGLLRYEPAVRTEVFHQQGARVARFHRPAPWAGPALVFLSDENTDDPAWWSALLPGDLDVRRIGTDHLGLLRVPHVTEVAAAVRVELDAREGH
ncbi:amino acid adenylation domain-containing protein [Geodermatophilus amargosae]|uniref:Amino acid adenylation domain-containing protein n=1 Tax=Geodermatophilus amargosae TaxID=1296565 RepID=A0A1I6X794_9ACTN|nr:alpha/beta fold hydrolase [Geodermatophilus amargosae]SFT34268.1 amino acid adenylation domain-containing protein [Geodermatophilus amargosae]